MPTTQSNTTLANRTAQLTRLPLETLKQVYRGVYGADAVCPNPKTMIKQLVKNEDIEWRTTNKDSDVKEEITQMNDWKMLTEILKLTQKSSQSHNQGAQEFTSLSMKMFLDSIFKVPVDKVIMWKEGGFEASVSVFLEHLSETCPNPSDAQHKASQLLQDFKDKVFVLVDKNIHRMIQHNLITDSCSACSLHGGTPPDTVGGYVQLCHILSDAFNRPENHDYWQASYEGRRKIQSDANDYVAPEITTEIPQMVCSVDMSVGGAPVTVAEATGGATGEENPNLVYDEDVPGMPDLNTHLGGLPTDDDDPPDLISTISSVPDVEEAPPVETTTADVVTEENAHLSVKIIANASEEALKVRMLAMGAVPPRMRQIKVNKITKNSWRKFRKEHNLGGRCEVYVMCDPGVLPKQNKCFRYCVGHVCDEGWEGSEPDMMPTGNGEGDEVPTGSFSSVYPYGEVYIITNSVD
jgi:hypothetical protein